MIHIKNYAFQERQIQISDSIESYFEFIPSCDMEGGTCIDRCLERVIQDGNCNF